LNFFFELTRHPAPDETLPDPIHKRSSQCRVSFGTTRSCA
jgi:hypothetical protein